MNDATDSFRRDARNALIRLLARFESGKPMLNEGEAAALRRFLGLPTVSVLDAPDGAGAAAAPTRIDTSFVDGAIARASAAERRLERLRAALGYDEGNDDVDIVREILDLRGQGLLVDYGAPELWYTFVRKRYLVFSGYDYIHGGLWGCNGARATRKAALKLLATMPADAWACLVDTRTGKFVVRQRARKGRT